MSKQSGRERQLWATLRIAMDKTRRNAYWCEKSGISRIAMTHFLNQGTIDDSNFDRLERALSNEGYLIRSSIENSPSSSPEADLNELAITLERMADLIRDTSVDRETRAGYVRQKLSDVLNSLNSLGNCSGTPGGK